MVVNGSEEIVLVNAEVERLFGYRRDELLGHEIEMLVPELYDRDGYPGTGIGLSVCKRVVERPWRSDLGAVPTGQRGYLPLYPCGGD